MSTKYIHIEAYIVSLNCVQQRKELMAQHNQSLTISGQIQFSIFFLFIYIYIDQYGLQYQVEEIVRKSFTHIYISFTHQAMSHLSSFELANTKVISPQMDKAMLYSLVLAGCSYQLMPTTMTLLQLIVYVHDEHLRLSN